MSILAGILIGFAFVMLFHYQMNPCMHNNTTYVMKCKDCGRVFHEP